jgi:hypothetical protein
MDMDANDVILIIGAGSAALVSIFVAIQKSRCYEIDCCFIKCKRKLPESPKKNKSVDVVDIV